MTDKIRFNSDSSSQKKRLFTKLKEVGGAGLTSHQVRMELDIYCPTARISDLRKRGHHIVTIRQTIDTGKGTHRVARWVLINEITEGVA